MRDIIRSSDNQFLKKIRKVQDRKKCPELVYIEGVRIVTDCLLSGGRCDSLILSERKEEEGRAIASEYGIDTTFLIRTGVKRNGTRILPT